MFLRFSHKPDVFFNSYIFKIFSLERGKKKGIEQVSDANSYFLSIPQVHTHITEGAESVSVGTCVSVPHLISYTCDASQSWLCS